MTESARIGLALSGGGFRATAFGLGALRALHDRDLLKAVRVVSGVSGGSLLAAMWAYGPTDFDEFDDSVTRLLRHGLQHEIIQEAARPRHLAKAAARMRRRLTKPGDPQPRSSRTEFLLGALERLVFGSTLLSEVTHPNLHTVLTATDLASTRAMRFGSRSSSLWQYGRVTTALPVAEAVTASAAFPVVFPALRRIYEFENRRGDSRTEKVELSDGGVFDNLGVSPLLPGRDPRYTDHVYEVDYVVAVDAGRGRSTKKTRSFTPFRLARAFDITYAKTQDGSRAQLHEAARHDQFRGFVLPYLATSDPRLPVPIDDLVPRSAVVDYPTDFRAVSPQDLLAITTRGEQLTRALVAHHCPDLL